MILAIIVFPFASIYVRFAFGLAVLLGCGWACANLFLIKFLVTSLLGEGPKKKYLIIAIIFIKFPLLYFLGYLMIKWSYLSVYGLLCGFSVIFLVTLLKVISRSILKLDNNPAKVL
jgi:hypothetical protein